MKLPAASPAVVCDRVPPDAVARLAYRSVEPPGLAATGSMRVYIITWCKDIANVHGSTLVFRTLRVGFPRAEVFVIDNASISAVRPLLRRQSETCGATFIQLEEELAHYEVIESAIQHQASGTVVFVDPDVCFWRTVEGWRFNALMAGRLLPRYACEYTGCITHPRLHTSLLYIPDVVALRAATEEVRRQFFEFDPIRPIMCRLAGVWHRWDTGASLYAALAERMHVFTESELEAYDHLFCGTHLHEVMSRISADYAMLFERLHRNALADHHTLKGAWRIQDQYFARLAA